MPHPGARLRPRQHPAPARASRAGAARRQRRHKPVVVQSKRSLTRPARVQARGTRMDGLGRVVQQRGGCAAAVGCSVRGSLAFGSAAGSHAPFSQLQRVRDARWVPTRVLE